MHSLKCGKGGTMCTLEMANIIFFQDIGYFESIKLTIKEKIVYRFVEIYNAMVLPVVDLSFSPSACA